MPFLLLHLAFVASMLTDARLSNVGQQLPQTASVRAAAPTVRKRSRRPSERAQRRAPFAKRTRRQKQPQHTQFQPRPCAPSENLPALNFMMTSRRHVIIT